MKSNLNSQVLLSSIARSQYKLHDIKQEWKVFILFIFLAKVLTWSISIFAGTNYFTLLLYPVLQHTILTISVAVLVLIIIEVLTTIALAKFFKFLFRGINHLSTIVVLALVVLGLFGISFISSTNGLAMRQANKVDNTKLIVERNILQKQQVKNEYKALFAGIDKQVNLIENNPQGWTGGKRTILLKQQSNKIDSLLIRKSQLLQEQKNVLIQLNTAKQSEINVNKQQTTAEADKYYKIITVVMVVQFICSGMLMFFFKRILNEDDAPSLMKERVRNSLDVMQANMFNLGMNEMDESINLITAQAVIANKKHQPTIEIESIPDKSHKPVIGFNNQLNKPVEQPDKKTSDLSSRLDNDKDLTSKNQQKNIAYLKKYKPIVKGIKLLRIPEDNSISNVDILRVRAIVKGSKRTTVRNVYMAAIIVGLDKIDENGNLIS